MQSYCFGYFGHAWLNKLKVILSSYRKPSCLFASKNSASSPCFIGDIERFANFLFWVCLVAHTQNDSINLYNTSIFTCMQKINFIIYFFLEILHFKESCNLIGWQHWELEFCQICGWWWNINNNISFHFRLCTRKIINRSFIENEKNYFGVILWPFCRNLRENKFSWRRELCKFLDIPIIYHRAKNKKKLLSLFWEKS